MESAEDTPLSDPLADPYTESNGPFESNFAFLVHSQDSLGHQSGPDVDNHRLARQKRRRTSPEDHATLEAEYQRNPKPDKVARQQIVQRVALGEKEVQIWFQNRRQTARRKSRPSSSQDLDLSVFSSQEDAISQPRTSDSNLTSSQPGSSSQSSILPSDQPILENDATKSCVADRRLRKDRGGDRSDVQVDRDVQSFEGVCQTFKLDSTGTMRPRDSADTLISLSPSKRRPGSLANRRSASFIIHEDHAAASKEEGPAITRSDSISSDHPTVPSKTQSLRRTSSLMKLSTNEEGEAELTPRTGETPSPPRPSTLYLAQSIHRRGQGLQRSFSAVEPVSTHGLSSSIPAMPPRRRTHGRSRDARTWEFYCDSQAQDALSKQAEREESGSATAAIGLIRSHSNKRPTLEASTNKRNATVQKNEGAKRPKTDDGKLSKPKLERATSSVARLQSSTTIGQKQRPALKHRKTTSQSKIFEDFEGDSDKENWLPGTQRRPEPPRRRPVTDQETARTLLESLREPSQTSSRSSLFKSDSSKQNSSTSKACGKENESPEVDDEVAAFMEGATLPREEEDLDCVQNLLSLSQAAWC